MHEKNISSDFPFESRYVTVNDAEIHYIEQGEGDPILFIHGIPTSNYLWRNIIPDVSQYGRCIAPDLVGMGKSSKPDIAYSVFEQIIYINRFIEAMKLTNITLVVHGWGSVIGLDYAMRNQENIKGLVFYESHLRPAIDSDMLSLPVQQIASLLSNYDLSHEAIMQENYFITKFLPSCVLRQLTEEELKKYEEPFQTKESRQPLWQYAQELPIGGRANDVVNLISNYSEKLQQSKLPKLLMYAIPGFITTIETVRWCNDRLNNLKVVDLGEALHFVQETNPRKFSQTLADWYQKLS